MDELTPIAEKVSAEVVSNTPWPMLGFVSDLFDENQMLKARVLQLEARLNQNSSNSNKPSSSDNPFKNSQDKSNKKSKSRRKRKGHRQQCLRPTEVIELFPAQCECGGTEFYDLEPYYIYQFIELPPTELTVKHIGLHCGRCSCCGKLNKALVPPENRAGFGPRISALIAELCGAHGDSRRAVQDLLFSVFDLPISQGGIQKILDRVSTAIEPHYEAIGDVAQSAAVNHIDETSWRTKNKLTWLWMMVSQTAAYFMVHPQRSMVAFLELIKDWNGILVSDGYGVYQKWAGLRQACLAHLIRRARGLSERNDPELAKCGRWGLRELQRLCHMAHEPPTRGQWAAFYMRLLRVISKYCDRKDEAGTLVRRLQDEMDTLWVSLHEEGVAPTNNHAERMLRFAVIWRKRSFGTASEKGNRWAERILSLRQTCRVQRRRTFPVLVDAMNSFFNISHSDFSWIHAGG